MFALVLVFVVFRATSGSGNPYEVIYEWPVIDYDFENDSIRHEMIKNGSFVPGNCFLNTLKIYGDMAFVSVARYLPGVPSTLNVIPYGNLISKISRSPKLTPFPSWEMQKIGNCSAIQLAHGLELDQYDRLFIVDAGRVDVFTPHPRNVCPPKLIIYDLSANKIDRVYEFPEDQVPRTTSGLKDIQVACTSKEDCHVFVSNINVTCSLVVYSYRHHNSWVATHSSMQPEMAKASMTIQGTPVMAPFGITAIGLSPLSTNFSMLYFSKMAGDRIYGVSTAILMDSSSLQENPSLMDEHVQDLGVKRMGQADGAVMDNHGHWYFGSLPESAVYSIDLSTGNLTGSIQNPIKHLGNSSDIQWIDSFSFDGTGNLVFTSTTFHRFLAKKLTLTEVNYRIIRFNTGTYAYST